MSRASAAVFDFDGVLSDSMPRHAEAYRRILDPYGVEPTDADVYALEGARSESIIRDLLEQADVSIDDALVARLGNQKQRVFAELGLPSLNEGAERLVTTVRRVAPKLALVTGTRQENLERIAPQLLPRFDAILAQDSYTHDKPHPEPYARAAERLGVEAGDCVALENAPRGVQSAKSAGYGTVVAITTTMPSDVLSDAGADVIVDDHDAAARALLGRFR